MKIVLDLPENCNPGFVEALKQLVDTVTKLVDKRGRHGDFAAVEMKLAQAAGRVEAEALGVVLASLDVDAPFIRVQGRRYRRLGPEPKTYKTLAGEVTIVRNLYRAADQRNGPTIDPISERVGMVGDGWLPATAKAMAHGLSMSTSREAASHAAQTGRLPYSRSSFERVGHLVGEAYCARNLEIEEILASQFRVPEAARSISVSLDRAAVPMEEIAANGEDVTRAFRMAHCGTLTFHDALGKALHVNRYGRMPAGSTDDLDETMQGDMAAALAQRRDLRVVVLADGAPEMWNRLEEIVEGVADDAVRLVDFWHVVEYISAAVHSIMDAAIAAATLERWKSLLQESETAWAVILAKLEQHDTPEVRAALTYIDNHRGRLGYASARADGLPVGSGNVEATCKSLLGQRLKRSGARWKTDTGEHVVELRALQLSDRWDQGVCEALKPLRQEVRKLAA